MLLNIFVGTYNLKPFPFAQGLNRRVAYESGVTDEAPNLSMFG